MKRCWPSFDDIVVRLQSLRWGLRTVFIATNADMEFLDGLRTALLRGGWTKVVTSRDLDLTWEQSGVENAIGMHISSFQPFFVISVLMTMTWYLDMELASRAEIFIGNGFSSMTSTVTRLRLVRGMEPVGTRFW